MESKLIMPNFEDYFICDNCEQQFEYGWSKEEMEEERLRLFPNLPEDQRAVTCDDCFKEIIREIN